MFTKVTIAGEDTSGLVRMESPIISWRDGSVIGTHVEYATPEQAEACQIPPRRQEIQLDQAKIAELHAWRSELLARFGH
jgi:hypothetical protein